MIYHVFELDHPYELHRLIIRSFLSLEDNNEIKDKQSFIIIEKKVNAAREIKKLFNEKGDKIKIINKLSKKELSKLIDKNDNIILHGISYKAIFQLVLYNLAPLHYVCWGSGTRINKNFQSVISYPFKLFIYKKQKNIITLLDGDKKDLNKYFGLINVSTLSYPSYKTKEELLLYDQLKGDNYERIIYVGNSGHSIDYYFRSLDIIAPLKKDFDEIHYMLQYGINHESDEFIRFKKQADKIFGEKLFIDIDYLNFTDYLKYMSRCTTYICPSPVQTGLGAISNCLRMGKKVYAIGKNFERYRNMGCVIFDYNNIYKTFLEILTDSQIKYNKQVLSNYNKKEQWISFLNDISE